MNNDESKRQLQSLYRSLEFFAQFCKLNHTAVRDLLSKMEEATHLARANAKEMTDKSSNAYCRTDKITELQQRIQVIVTCNRMTYI